VGPTDGLEEVENSSPSQYSIPDRLATATWLAEQLFCTKKKKRRRKVLRSEQTYRNTDMHL
jgi:hypothetical protein